MERGMFFAFMALAIFIAPSGIIPTVPSPQPRALILSSTQGQTPMQYLTAITSDLKQAGYNVTFMTGSAITLNLLLTLFNQYDILIWRTANYMLGNTTYWYLGQQSNETALAAFAGANPTRTVDIANGMVAVSSDFFKLNFGPASMHHIKLAILSSSISIILAQDFTAAGVGATIDFYNTLDAPTTEFDWITWSLIGYLTSGYSVNQAVTKTVYNFQYVGSLDPTMVPPLSFLGNGNLQITA